MNLLARVDAKFQMDLVILQGPCGDPIRTFCPNHLPTPVGFSCRQEVARGPKPTFELRRGVAQSRRSCISQHHRDLDARSAEIPLKKPGGIGETFRTVGDYYAAHGGAVRIEDVSQWLSELAEGLIADPAADLIY